MGPLNEAFIEQSEREALTEYSNKSTISHLNTEYGVMTTPSRVWSSFPVAMSKMLMIPSMAPLAKYFPSGL